MNKTHYYYLRLVSIIVMAICSLPTNAQVATISGTGTTGSYLYNPMYSINANPRLIRNAVLYPAAQLSAAGLVPGAVITSINYERTSGTNAMIGNPNLQLYLENRPASELDFGSGALTWATVIAPATYVFDADPSTIAGTSPGWKTFPFGTGAGTSSSFIYTGGALVVYSEWTQTTSQSATINWTYQTPATATPATVGWTTNSAKYGLVSSGTPPVQSATLGTSTGNHPNTQFNFTAPPCTTPPTAGIATLVSGPICSGGFAIFNLAGYSSGSGVTIQWQYYNGTSWVNATGVTGANTAATNITATTQYRAAVTCGANTVYSNTLTVYVVPTFTSSGTYTLNSAAPTAGTNFQTIHDLDSALLCGVTGPLTINVNAAGTYSGQLHLKNMGSAASPIIINGNGATINYEGALDTDRACIRLENADYVTINNLNITLNPNATYGWGIQLTNDADNCTINGCTINTDISLTSTFFGGIVVSGSLNSSTTTAANVDNLTINNTTVNGGYYGITLFGASGTPLNNTQITNCNIKNTYAYAIYASYSNNMLIRGNDISRENRASTTTFAGCYLPNGHIKMTIDKNKIHDWFTTLPTSTSTGYGIYITASTPTAGNENIISNNVIYNTYGNGTQYGIYNSASSYAKYYYNTFVFDYTASAATTQVCYGLYHTSATPNCEFRNNIVYITRGGAGNKAAVYMNTATTSVVSANYNNYYINSATTGTNYIGAMGATLQSTMSGWQTASGGDANSLLIDPVFVNPLLGVILPTAATGLNNMGTPISGITTDITGATRNATTPDMGAYEWTPPTCLQPAGLNVTALTSTGATLGWNAVTGATGYEWAVTTSITPPASGTSTSLLTAPSGTLTQATFYYLHVRANCGAGGYSYWNTLQFATPPVNDDCANSINISSGAVIPGSTIGATQSMAACATTATTTFANDAWYHFTTTTTGDVTVNASNLVGDIALELFSGTCGTFTSLGCVDGPAIGTETITIPALAPGTYYARVYGYLSSQNPFTIQVLMNGWPLSAKTIDIAATNRGSYNLVNWTASTELKSDFFELEKSSDGKNFASIARAAANTSGEYVYNDNKPTSGMNYYRVKMVDKNGTGIYSKVAYTSVKDIDVFHAEAYPNPVKDKFTVKLYGNQASNARISLTDITGKLIRQVAVTNNETTIDMSGMDKGIYFVKYTDVEHSEVMKITLQ